MDTYLPCQGCGKPAKQTPKARRRKWCSERCRRQTSYGGTCTQCGTPTNGNDGPGTAAELCNHCLPSTIDFRRKISGPRASAWSETELLDALRAEATNGSVSKSRYDASGRIPSSSTIIDRFGTWNAALQTAGLKPGTPWRNHYPKMSVEQLLDAVRACAGASEVPPTYAAYETWAHATGGPSGSLIRQRCGGWMTALEMAGVA